MSSLFSKIGAFIDRFVGRAMVLADITRQRLVNAMRRDNRVGELEKRFTPVRLLGGYRLQRTGKHRLSKAGTWPKPAGSKLWRKAAEHKL